MDPSPPEHGAGRPLDAVALARVSRRLHGAAGPPWLHAEVARRMAERLLLLRQPPRVVVDWGARLGASAGPLAQACPKARRLAVACDDAPRGAAAGVPPWWSPRRWTDAPQPVLEAAALAPAQADLVWCNMQLHGAVDPRPVMAAWQRVLVVDGCLMFSTLGPGTLDGLRRLYAQAGWPTPMAPLVDMHDLGDMLVEAGFADPVMDQETLTLTWPTPAAALAELRGLGGNVDPARHAGLRTPGWRAELERQLAATAAADGRVGLQFEIVYGQAFKALPRTRVAPQATLSMDELRTQVRSARRRV